MPTFLSPPSERTLRVACVQLDYQPRLFTSQQGMWIPAEPFVRVDQMFDKGVTADHSLENPALSPAVRRASAEIIDASESEYERDLELRLGQILSFLVSASVDLVVFPEYAIHPSAVRVLAGYREYISSFAGLGLVRDEDLEALREFASLSDLDDLSDRNAAVFVDSDSTRFVTKMHPARMELLTPGRGREVVRFRKREISLTVGLAICMDFLQPSAAEQADVDLVSALSRKTEDFRPSTPRNLRVVANHSTPGGSLISAANVESPAFVDDRGVAPLPPNCEALIVVDWEGPQTTPTTLKAVRNSLQLRSALLYDDGQPGDVSDQGAMAIARKMQGWQSQDVRSGALSQQIEAALEYVTQANANGVLEQALSVLATRRHPWPTRELQLVTQHLGLVDVRSPDEWRYSTVQRLQERWLDLARSDEVEVGGLIDLASQTRRSLAAKARRVASSLPAHTTGVPTDPDMATVLLNIRLGRFRGEDAVRSLADQAHFLSVLAASANPAIKLEYRVTTERSANGDLVPLFDVRLVAAGLSKDAAIDLSYGLGRTIEVAFRQAYAVSRLDEEYPASAPYLVSARAPDGAQLAIREDWAQLIDYLRSLDGPSSLTLRVSPSGMPARRIHDRTMREPSGFISELQQTAAEFMYRYGADEPAETLGLHLEVELGSSKPLGPSVSGTVLSRLFGAAPLLAPGAPPHQALPLSSLSPAEALRVFHPPYGHLAGRGLTGGSPGLAMPSVPALVAGVEIGTARAQTGVGLVDVPVRLSPRSRLQHTYVVGRTGSGKTNLLKNLARQDIESGAGLAVIDPHGDLVDYLLGHVGSRLDEVVLLDFGDRENLPVLNPLDLDVKSPGDVALAIEDFISLLTRQTYHEWYGPRFEGLVRMALQAITSDGYPLEQRTILEVERLLRTDGRRKWIGGLVQDPDLRSRWQEFDRQQGTTIAEVLHWALSKFSEMTGDRTIGQVLGGGPSTVSILDPVLNGGILLVRLPEWEMSRSSAQLLGTLIQEKIRKAVFRRGVDRGSLVPFYLYVDEFQTFATTDFDELVAEARKFGLGLVLAHQNLRQLEEFSLYSGQTSSRLRDAILSNVTNLVTFGSSRRDNEELAHAFEIEASDIGGLPRYAAMVRSLQGDELLTFTTTIPAADADLGSPEARTTAYRREVESGRVQPRAKLIQNIEERESEIARLLQGSAESSMRIKSEGGSKFLDEWLTKRRSATDQSSRDEPADESSSGPDLDEDAAEAAPLGNSESVTGGPDLAGIDNDGSDEESPDAGGFG